MRVIKLYEGIKYNKKDDTYDINFNEDDVDDIIKLKTPQIYQSEFKGNIYYFGYKFEDSVPSRDRSRFIQWIKGLADNKPTNYQYREIISKPLSILNKQIGLQNIDLFVYPQSNRSELVQKMIMECGDILQRDTESISMRLLKNTPSNIQFDWKAFDRDFEGDAHAREQIYSYVENDLLPKIHGLDYFSLAKSVKPKYRRYIKDFLIIGDSFKVSSLASAKNILIVDDVNTSGATLSEILKIIGNVNNEANIFIFTLLGNDR